MAVQYSNVQSSEIPDYIKDPSIQLLNSVGGKFDPVTGQLVEPGLMQQPYQTYNEANPNNQRVVGQDQYQIDAYNLVKGNQGIGAYQQYLADANAAADAAGNFSTALPPKPYGNQAGYDAYKQANLSGSTSKPAPRSDGLDPTNPYIEGPDGEMYPNYVYSNQGSINSPTSSRSAPQFPVPDVRIPPGEVPPSDNPYKTNFPAQPNPTQPNVDMGIGSLARQSFENAATTGMGPNGAFSQFQNPYQQDVIDATMTELDRQRAMDINDMNAGAANAGAYGGSRHGVAEAELRGNYDRNKVAALAQLNTQGFNTAADMTQNYLGRNAQVGQGAGQLGIAEGNLNLDRSRVESGIGGLAQQYGINDINLLATYGDRSQGYNQMVRDSNVNEFYEKETRPFQMAGFYNDMIQGTPSSSSTLTSQSAPSPSSIAQGIGALGTYASIGQDFGWWGNDD